MTSFSLNVGYEINPYVTCFKYLSLHANKHPLLRRINLSLGPTTIRGHPMLKHLTFDLRKGVLSRIRLSLQEANTSTPICTVTLLNVRSPEYLADRHIPGPGDGDGGGDDKGDGTSPKKEGART